jgi:hypothetical protein
MNDIHVNEIKSLKTYCGQMDIILLGHLVHRRDCHSYLKVWHSPIYITICSYPFIRKITCNEPTFDCLGIDAGIRNAILSRANTAYNTIRSSVNDVEQFTFVCYHPRSLSTYFSYLLISWYCNRNTYRIHQQKVMLNVQLKRLDKRYP